MSAKVKQGSGDNGGKRPKKAGKRRRRVPFSVTKQQRRGLSAAAGAGIPPYADLQRRGTKTAGGGT